MASGIKADSLAEEIKEFCESVTQVSDNRMIVEVDRGRVIEVCERLRERGFDHVKGVTGVDRPDVNAIEVIYYVGSYSVEKYAGLILELKTRLPKEDPKMPSLIKVWPSCEYPERETYEMLGVIFQGHPKLKLMLLPEDFEGVYPLRKGFKIPEEGIEA